MKAWDIFSWQAPGWPEPHPAVIVSHPDRVAHKPDVTVLICASRRTTRQPEPNEVILDANDGLDWPTLCKCDLLYTIQNCFHDLAARSGAVLFVGDLLHPVNDLAVESLRDSDVRHGRGGGGSMPMFFARREPDDIAGMDCLDRAAFALHASAASSHDQRLPQRMRVPRGASAGFKGDYRAADTGEFAPLER